MWWGVCLTSSFSASNHRCFALFENTILHKIFDTILCIFLTLRPAINWINFDIEQIAEFRGTWFYCGCCSDNGVSCVTSGRICIFHSSVPLLFSFASSRAAVCLCGLKRHCNMQYLIFGAVRMCAHIGWREDAAGIWNGSRRTDWGWSSAPQPMAPWLWGYCMAQPLRQFNWMHFQKRPLRKGAACIVAVRFPFRSEAKPFILISQTDILIYGRCFFFNNKFHCFIILVVADIIIDVAFWSRRTRWRCAGTSCAW